MRRPAPLRVPGDRRAGVPCTRARAEQATVACRAIGRASARLGDEFHREEKESPGCSQKEPPESDAGQRPDQKVPRRRADARRGAGRRSRSSQGRAVAAPHDHRGSRGGKRSRRQEREPRRLRPAGRRYLDLPARPRGPGARPDLDGPWPTMAGPIPAMCGACSRPWRSRDEASSRWATMSGFGPGRPPAPMG